MSERFKIAENVHGSKNTRLSVAEEFSHYRFGRDALAHASRYLYVCEQLVALAKSLGPLRVLDIGCGDAYIARVLQASFAVRKRDVLHRYVGLDIDDVRLARTEETLPRSFAAELVCADVTDGGLAGFGNNEFDVVVCMEVIEHLQPVHVPVLLREVRRISRRAYISTPNFAGGTGKLPEDHIKEWTVSELARAFADAGIRVERSVGVFSNLNKVQALAKKDRGLQATLDFLSERMDSHLLSLVMARFIGARAQNVLYVCALP